MRFIGYRCFSTQKEWLLWLQHPNMFSSGLSNLWTRRASFWTLISLPSIISQIRIQFRTCFTAGPSRTDRQILSWKPNFMCSGKLLIIITCWYPRPLWISIRLARSLWAWSRIWGWSCSTCLPQCIEGFRGLFRWPQSTVHFGAKALLRTVRGRISKFPRCSSPQCTRLCIWDRRGIRLGGASTRLRFLKPEICD